MLRTAIVAALLSVGATAPQPFPTQWPVQKFVRWQPQWGDRTFAVDGLQLAVTIKHCGVDRPSSEACSEGTPYVVATAHAAGAAPVVLQGSPGVAADIGIGPLEPNTGAPSVILISESGGSSGCVTIDRATPVHSGYEVSRLSPRPADHGTICVQMDWQKLGWPADITRHHRSEFLFMPHMFACDLTSCAGGWPVPQVIALDAAGGKDVSADLALAPLYRANMSRALDACRHQVVEAQGPCAGYAFDAKRLGLLDQAWPAIDAEILRGCRVAHESPCADVDKIPAGFHERLAKELELVAPLNSAAD